MMLGLLLGSLVVYVGLFTLVVYRAMNSNK
jgi:hypothetical protein